MRPNSVPASLTIAVVTVEANENTPEAACVLATPDARCPPPRPGVVLAMTPPDSPITRHTDWSVESHETGQYAASLYVNAAAHGCTERAMTTCASAEMTDPPMWYRTDTVPSEYPANNTPSSADSATPDMNVSAPELATLVAATSTVPDAPKTPMSCRDETVRA